MKKILEEIKKTYIETLEYNGEISFDYNNHHYHIEPKDDKNGNTVFDVAIFTALGSDDGKTIATLKTPEDVISAKIFDKKNILEINDEMKNCNLY